MHKLYTCTVNELQKILLQRKTHVLALFLLVIPVAMALGVSSFQQHIGVLAFGSGDFSVWILDCFTTLFLPLFIFMWVADSFAGEVDDQSIKIVLLRPITRFKVYLAKNLAIISLVLLTLLVVLCFSELAGLFYSIPGAAHLLGWGRGLGACVLALFPLLALTVLAAFVAQFFRNSSGALAINLLIYIVAFVLPFFSPLAGRLTPVAYINWHLLWLASSINWSSIGQALIIILAWILIFFPAGFYLFEHKDI